MTDDFYTLLEVPPDASQDDIKDAFREKVQEYHPDHNDDPRANAQFTAVKKAYDTLGDPVERNAYDRMGHIDYVAKRLDGLPSPEKWAPSKVENDESGASQIGSGSTGSSSVGSTGSRSTGSSRSSGSSTGSGSTRSSTGTGSTGGSRSTGSSGTGSTGTGTTGSSAGTGSTGSSSTGSSGRSYGSGSTSTGSTSSTGPSGGTGGSNRRRTASDGAGAAVSRRTHATPEDPVVAWLARHGYVRSVVGWPLLWLVATLYLAGVGLVTWNHASAMSAFVDRLAAAGADPDALASAFEREGLPVFFDAAVVPLLEGATQEPLVLAGGLLLLVGAIALPAVVLVLVYLTRTTPGWEPTYLYVVATLGPLVALGVGAATAVPLSAELALVGLLPVGGLFVMVLSAFVRPRVVAAIRD